MVIFGILCRTIGQVAEARRVSIRRPPRATPVCTTYCSISIALQLHLHLHLLLSHLLFQFSKPYILFIKKLKRVFLFNQDF